MKKLLVPLTIFIIALIFRLVPYLELQNNVHFNYLMLDEKDYYEWGKSIAEGDWLSTEYLKKNDGILYKPPGYSYFVGIVCAVFGTSLNAVRIVQIILGSVSCVLLFFLSKLIYRNVKAAIFCGLGMAVYGTVIYFDIQLLEPVLYVFFLLLFFILFITAAQTDERRYWIGAGVCAALLAAVRGNIILYYIIGIPLVFYWSNISRKKMLYIFIPVLITILLHTGYNRLNGGRWIVLTSNSAVNFYIGNNVQATGYSAYLPSENLGGMGWYYRKYDGNYFARSVKDWFRHPAQMVKIYARKLFLIFSPYEIENNKNIYFISNYSRLLNILNTGFRAGYFLFTLPFLLLLPCITALFIKWKQNKSINIFIACYILSIIFFFTNAKFRVVMVPFFILGLNSVSVYIRKKKYIIPAVLVMILFSINIVKADVDKDNLSCSTYYNIAANPDLDYRKRLQYLEKAYNTNPPAQLKIELLQKGIELACANNRIDIAVKLIDMTRKIDKYDIYSLMILSHFIVHSPHAPTHLDSILKDMEYVIANSKDKESAQYIRLKMNYEKILR